MKTIEATKSKTTLEEYLQNLTDEPLLITVKGKPVAALISVENIDLETAKLSSHPDFIKIIERARSRYKSEGGISSKEMRLKFKSAD